MRTLHCLAPVVIVLVTASCLYGRDVCGELHGDDDFEDRVVSCPEALPFMCIQASGPTSCQATANEGVPGIQCAECASADGCVLEKEPSGPDVCVSTANSERSDAHLRHCVCAGFPQTVPCKTDAHCVFPNGFEAFCDVDEGRCVTCRSDRDCDGNDYCVRGSCVQCRDDDDCPYDESCVVNICG